MTKDYYQTLELPRNASQRDIKHAYRQLARKYHPDFNPGDPTAEDRMEDINRAYEVLSDKSRRAEYDRYQRVESRAPAEEEPKQKTTFEEARQQASVYDRLSPYEVLGLSPNDGYREVREAFAEFIRMYGDAVLSDPSAGLAYQHVKSAYFVLSNYERRRRYNAEHGLPDPPLPDDEEDDRPLGALDGLGDWAWIISTAVVAVLFLVTLLAVFEPYWLR